MFFALLFAIIETSAVFFAGQYLETGTQDAARALLIDDVQSKGTNQADFKQSICDKVSALFACDNIYVDVQSFPKGDPITIVNPIDDNGNFINNFKYEPPPPKSENTVVVRAFYQWPIFVTGLGYNIANISKYTSNSKYLLAATAALRPQ
jgi:Flp pilus assembly protein TadG